MVSRNLPSGENTACQIYSSGFCGGWGEAGVADHVDRTRPVNAAVRSAKERVMAERLLQGHSGSGAVAGKTGHFPASGLTSLPLSKEKRYRVWVRFTGSSA
jgi:hypothetical protein